MLFMMNAVINFFFLPFLLVLWTQLDQARPQHIIREFLWEY